MRSFIMYLLFHYCYSYQLSFPFFSRLYYFFLIFFKAWLYGSEKQIALSMDILTSKFTIPASKYLKQAFPHSSFSSCFYLFFVLFSSLLFSSLLFSSLLFSSLLFSSLLFSSLLFSSLLFSSLLFSSRLSFSNGSVLIIL